jgi:hypothetical protein
MLIVNDAHLCLAGRSSLEDLCHYCKKPLAAYPLVMSDDAKQTVYHVTCAPASPQTSWSIWRPSSILQLCINHCMFSRLPTPLLP